MITKCTYKSVLIMNFTYTDLGEWFCTGFISLVVSSGSLVWKKSMHITNYTCQTYVLIS